MPKSTPQSRTAARIARTEAYAAQVQSLFMQTVNRIIALNKKLPDLPEGEMFSFDAQTEKLRREVEMCLRQLHSVATTAITNGIALEWNTANAECNKLITSTFGKKTMETMQMTAWSQRNGAAMKAFIARSESGMNLSDRVWQSTRQLRDEMEIAITVAVGDGTSAASLSRNVRKYLNDPDLMFRRFRYKDPKTGEWRRKWKKRVIDPATGKVTFIDYDKDSYQDQWTGRGYYKSAAQNAMRVARTETNIAYRRADNERWQQMDFVVGQRIQLSRNHPHKDICDKLQGDYPKDFVFDGWHPQCFCFATPIILDEDEILNIMSSDNWQDELAKAAARHEIKDYPANFKNWVHDNADNIAAARARGTEPYFIRNNAGIIDNILTGETPPTAPMPTATPTPATSAAPTPQPETTPTSTPAEIKKQRYEIIKELTLEAYRYPDSPLAEAYIKSMRECWHKDDIEGFNAEQQKLLKLIESFRQEYTSGLTYSPEQLKRFAEMETTFGITRGKPMTLSEADVQKTNPDYSVSESYRINCQTCAPAYVLRSQGFDVTASANTPGSVNNWISRQHSFDIWENVDGTPAVPTLYHDWMKTKGYSQMSPKRYKEFYEEATTEPGIYITTIKWKGGSGAHATIVQRFADGTLAYIEPQHYNGKSMKLDIMELCNNGTIKIPSNNLRGIMRVDDKLLKKICTYYGKDYDIWSIFRAK